MSTIKSHEDENVRFSKLMALLYYHMCEEFYARLGEEEGKKAISNVVRAFGDARIKAMKEEAEERKITIVDNESYHLVRDMPNPGYRASWKDGVHCVEYCPFADVWADYGEKGLEYGALYCEIDNQIFDAFGLKLKRDHILTTTRDYCEFIVEKKAENS